MNIEKEIFDIALTDIMPNRFQPREMFDQKALEELAQSIKEHGVIQPIIARKVGDKYEIVAGERRFRASKLANKESIPALVRVMDDKEVAKIALLENLQRQNLSAIEEAKTYNTILELDNMTQEELAKNLGKSQATIANKLRLLNLAEEVQASLLNEEISERHARSLLSLKDKSKQKDLLEQIKEKRLTVKQLDEAIKLENNPSETKIEQPEITSMPKQSVETPTVVPEPIISQPRTNTLIKQEGIKVVVQEEKPVEQTQNNEIEHQNNPFEKLRIYNSPTIEEDIKEETNINNIIQPTVMPAAEVPIQEPTIIPELTKQPVGDIYDARFAINNVRQAIQNNIKFGVPTNAKEEDMGDMYKITITIPKAN